MGSAKSLGLGLLAVVFASATSVNGFLLYRAFRAASSDLHYKIVVKSSDPQDSKSLVGELRDVPGVSVLPHPHTNYHKTNRAGHYWLGTEVPTEMARTMQQNLQSFKYPASVETVDTDKVVVHLQEDFPSEAAAARTQHAINQKGIPITVKPMQAFHVERSSSNVLEVEVQDAEHAKAVQAIVAKHNLTLEPVSEQP